MEVMLNRVSYKRGVALFEDEEVREEEERAVAEAREWLRHNKPVPHEEVVAEFGFTMADFERMRRTPLPEEKNGSSH